MNLSKIVGISVLLGMALLPGHAFGQTSSFSCPSGTYDMLDWMTMDSSMRSSHYLGGTSNPLYTDVWNTKFYWTKGAQGYPWDIQLFDNNYIYLWITEYAWNSPNTFKKFSYDKNMPLAQRCTKGGYPGSQVKVSNTTYDIYTDCTHYTRHNLRNAVNEVWGPYTYTFGGDLPPKLQTMVVSYRYNCDSSYGSCADKEEYYLAKGYGLVEWVHYQLVGGQYEQQQKSVFNKVKIGSTSPKFQCF